MKHKKLVIAFVVIDLLLLTVYLGGSWYFSSVLITFSRATLAEDAALSEDPVALGLSPPEEVSIAAGDVTLAGWYFDNPDAGNCGVLLLHGRSSTRYGMLRFAPLFWDHGCDLLLYDARYHGNSTGQYGTYGYYESDDALAALDWFTQRTGLPRAQVGLMGTSYGAATALLAAAKAPDIAFVAADSSYRDMKTIVTEQGVQQYGGFVRLFIPGAFAVAGLRAHFDPYAVSPMLAAAQIRVPAFLLHSLQDTYTLPAHSQDIYDHLGETRKVLYLTDWGASHSASVTTNLAGYQAYMDDFLAAYVPQFPPVHGK
ncbi:MAG: alpha/beta fold hydrolase [Anaerolineales bacterium]|nr:alpha/beta fold hydrolase [Anaerolineales bacterium]MCB8951969.1 alpha/beta fold hydrolase [Ardenticatenales bacterium]